MMKKTFMPLSGAVVSGMSAYAGYRTYDAYNGVNESDLLLANAEALASDDEGLKCDNKNGCKSWKLNPVFDSRKGFYDCCYVYREAYSPEGTYI
jgi:hypothetical protein